MLLAKLQLASSLIPSQTAICNRIKSSFKKWILETLLIYFQFWVAYAPCRSSDKDAVQITIEQIDLITRLVAQYPDHMKLALTADGKQDALPFWASIIKIFSQLNPFTTTDIVQAHKEGKIASLIGVEGGKKNIIYL